MKIPFILLATLITLSVVIPFLIFVLKGLNTSTKKEVEKLTKQNNFKYAIKEVWNNKFIGISEDKNILTYINFKADENLFINIDLSEIKTCELLKGHQTNKDKVSHLKQLDLKLTYKSSGKKDLIINFFDTNETFMENYELRRIENWQELVASNLSDELVTRKAS